MTELETAPAAALPQPACCTGGLVDPGLAVLLIAADPARGRALTRLLDGLGGGSLRLTTAPSLAAGIACLAAGPLDCILLSLGPPTEPWASTLAELRALAPDLPILVCGASEDESLGRTLIAAGAEDYLSPADQDARQLARALGHAVERHRLRGQQRRRAEAEDLVDQRESEQRGVGRLLSQTGRAGETARLYGAANLRDSDPGLFEELLTDYQGLIEHTAASQVFRLRPGEQRSARPLAERMGFMGAGPRDVIELHTEALRRLGQRISPTEERHIALEGRIVILELMGYLAGYYRRYYLSRMSLSAAPQPG